MSVKISAKGVTILLTKKFKPEKCLQKALQSFSRKSETLKIVLKMCNGRF